jgi:hypothetical protein
VSVEHDSVAASPVDALELAHPTTLHRQETTTRMT